MWNALVNYFGRGCNHLGKGYKKYSEHRYQNVGVGETNGEEESHLLRTFFVRKIQPAIFRCIDCNCWPLPTGQRVQLFCCNPTCGYRCMIDALDMERESFEADDHSNETNSRRFLCLTCKGTGIQVRVLDREPLMSGHGFLSTVVVSYM